MNPRPGRPTLESMAIDVFSTVRKLGYPIEVLKDYSEEMNRYAILLIEQKVRLSTPSGFMIGGVACGASSWAQ
jgi:hypothetical protein